jgi:hypothetical protein
MSKPFEVKPNLDYFTFNQSKNEIVLRLGES